MSPDMNLICSGGEDKKLLIWDQNKKKHVQKYDMFDQPITKAVFHPIEPWVISSEKTKNISVHDLREEKIVQHYEAHHDSINSISVHPSGNFFASVSGNS